LEDLRGGVIHWVGAGAARSGGARRDGGRSWRVIWGSSPRMTASAICQEG
jgi:hypothetical protein